MTDDQGSHLLAIIPTARRQLADHLPGPAAAAAYEFSVGPLLANPHRVGKRLRPPLDDRHSARRGTYRVVHRTDDDTHTVTVLDVAHRRGAWRLRRRIPHGPRRIGSPDRCPGLASAFPRGPTTAAGGSPCSLS